MCAIFADAANPHRLEMTKFTACKAPLNMLKHKMQIKAKQIPAFQHFSTEIANITDEQGKFLENLEYVVAVAEATDSVQVTFLKLNDSCRLSGASILVSSFTFII